MGRAQEILWNRTPVFTNDKPLGFQNDVFITIKEGAVVTVKEGAIHKSDSYTIWNLADYSWYTFHVSIPLVSLGHLPFANPLVDRPANPSAFCPVSGRG